MSTICFFLIPAVGHVNPALPLLRALVARGDRVICFNTPEYREKLEQTGAEFRPSHIAYNFAPPQGTLAPFKAMGLILNESAHVIPQHLAETRALAPDLILYDSMCPWGKQIAQLLNVPAVCSCSIMYAGWINFRSWPRNTDLSRGMLRSPFRVARDILRYQQTAQRLRRTLRVTSPSFMDFFSNPGDLTLLYTSRYFQIGGELFDDTFKFIGASVEPRRDAPPFDFAWLGDAPLIYVSLGTIFNDRPDFFRACIHAFGNTSYRVVMAIGKNIRPDAFGLVPENICMAEYLPQLELLPRASVFITHGGMNSVSEAAWYGTPMLVAPQVGDQVFIAHQITKLGAGEQMDSHIVTPDQLRADLERVRGNPRYRQGSRKIGDSFRAAGGIPKALADLDAFLSTRKPQAERHNMANQHDHRTI